MRSGREEGRDYHIVSTRLETYTLRRFVRRGDQMGMTAKVLATTGVSGLDTILLGGLPADRCYLVEGAPGTGKTTLALQFLLEGVRRGEPVLYISLSETEAELLEVAQSHGWSLDGISILELSAIEQQLALETQNTLFHPAEIELSQTTQILLSRIEEASPTRLAIDSLSELRLLAQNGLRFRRQLLGLKQFFTHRNCTVLFLDDSSHQAGDLRVESIAHGVLSLELLPTEYGAERRRLRIRKLRGVNFKSGYHDYNVKTGGIAVYPRLVASEDRRQRATRVVHTDIPELDMLVGGGLDLGTSTLIMGPSGVGKSTIAFLYAVSEAERGHRSVIFTFDETLEVAKARTRGLGIAIEEHLDKGTIHLSQVDPGELSPGEFVHQIRAEVEKQDVSLLVIDSLNGYLNSMPGERHLLIQLHELLAYLNQRGILTLMVYSQHGIYASPERSIDLTYLSDTVILLRYFEMRGAIRKAISAVKKRTGQHEDTIRELRTDRGVHVGEVLHNFQGILTGVPSFLGQVSQMPGKDERGGTSGEL